MANGILRISGYSKFSTSISPLNIPAELNALSVDSHFLFSLFCSQNIKRKYVRLNIYDLSNRKIVFKEVATENKDAVFNWFFFYIERIKTEAKSYRQHFAHSMLFLSGLKTVRVLELLIKNSSSHASNVQVNDVFQTKQQNNKPSKKTLLLLLMR